MNVFKKRSIFNYETFIYNIHYIYPLFTTKSREWMIDCKSEEQEMENSEGGKN